MPRPSGPLPGPALALLAVLLASTTARAELPGVSLAARVGYTLPSLDDDTDVSARYLPVQLDAMAVLPLGFRAGVYGSYGFPGPDNGGGFEGLLRVGVQVHYRIPLPVVHPWVGVGTGYARTAPVDSTTAVNDDVGRDRSTSNPNSSLVNRRSFSTLYERGWEPFNLQAGVQFSLLPRLELGPFVQYEYGTKLPSLPRTSISTSAGPVTATSNATTEGARVTRLTFGLRAELTF
ncbi:MAG: hypothetical protein EOO75_00030 [Myxococcales bacterium]|nr:MAG: hypothetical protein EOO75_00030 [Myxococcales bacterium]